jgi:pyridoxal phosphate enzyme (YggS family)
VSRRAELTTRLGAVRHRIADACAAAGRERTEVTLVAVTKTFPASDIRLLAELGVTDIGENRDQEAAPKAAELAAQLAGLADPPRVRWHFVGQLQRNKARSVVGYADVVHAVDRVRLASSLGRAVAAERPDRPLDVLVQVDLEPGEPDPERGGAAPDDLAELAAAVADTDGLRLRGLMAVAPLDADPEPAFTRLAALAAEMRATHPDARWISAGMSGDLEAAIRHGATHVRVGTALLGRRPAPQR